MNGISFLHHMETVHVMVLVELFKGLLQKQAFNHLIIPLILPENSLTEAQKALLELSPFSFLSLVYHIL